MSQEVSTYNLILAVFAATLAAVDCLNEYAQVLNIGYRPMPAELASEMENKTDYEMKLEDCMSDLISCLSNIGKKQFKICAQATHLEWKTFDTMCDMLYENCKGYGTWHFLNDGGCQDSE